MLRFLSCVIFCVEDIAHTDKTINREPFVPIHRIRLADAFEAAAGARIR